MTFCNKTLLLTRLSAVQALYRMDVIPCSPEEAVKEIAAFHFPKKLDLHLLHSIVSAVSKYEFKIDESLPKDIKCLRLDRIVLRCAAMEIKQNKVHRNIILSSYITICMQVASFNFYRLLNKVFDVS